ncbi:MAG: PmoA family protein [bacterium]|jgi:hypothetical protein|nr:PmoA family protein [bacterium]
MKKNLFALFVLTCSLGLMSASALEIVVKSDVAVKNSPVMVSVAGNELPDGDLSLVRGEKSLPAQVLSTSEGSVLCFVVDELAAGEEAVYALTAGTAEAAHAVQIEKGAEALVITIGGEPFTSYVFASEAESFHRPYFYPLLGPDGVRMTRGFPMDKHEGEATDHPHHQSLWVAHGDVNGTDNWAIGSRCGTTKQVSLDAVQAGPVCGQFASTNVWYTAQGKPLLTDRRTFTIWGTRDEGRYVDFDLVFTADQEDVVFGDTKEGGLISLRVAPTLRVERVDKQPGGHILTSEGDRDGQAWGKAGSWCDYSGPVADRIAGLTIMDHPGNPFYPTHYHVRTYGLFTANPFGLSDFKGKEFDGSRTLKKGESWRVRYRLFIHEGDAEAAELPARYAAYSKGLQVDIR